MQPSSVTSIDAPVEGWNAFNSVDDMPPTAAIVLDNLIPSAGKVVSRLGSAIWTDLETNLPVETLASVELPGINQFFAASGNKIFNIEDPLAPVEETLPGPVTNSQFQITNHLNLGGNGVSIWCNGSDPAMQYDGISWTYLVDTNGVGTEFVDGLSYKGRMFYWKEDEAAFYYAQAGSSQGDLKKFELGSFLQKGGAVLFMDSWTQQDSGDGKDDFLVIVSTKGEILIYQGDDPDSGGFWEMIGRYITSEPLSVRGHEKFGTDTIIMTKDGYVSLSTIVQQGRVSDVNQFSRLIYSAVTDRTRNSRLRFGWEATLWPRGGLMFFNVPISPTTYQQHVLNLITMRWCRFTGWNTICMIEHEERLFGGLPDGRVISLMEGNDDLGNEIQCKCLMAYNSLEAPGRNKHLCAAEVRTTARRPEGIEIDAYAGYIVPPLPDVANSQANGDQATWSRRSGGGPPDPGVGGSLWNEDYWATGDRPITTSGWQNVSAYGEAVAVAVRFSTINEVVTWRSTNIRYYLSGVQ